MIKYGLIRLGRSVVRTLRRLPRVPRTVARNVLMLWFFVIVAVGAGAAWKMYVQDDAALLQFARDEWQAGVDKIGEMVPGAVAFVAEQKTWVLAVFNSALPRQELLSRQPGGSAQSAGEDGVKGDSAWRRAADLVLRIALGYDVTDEEELLAAAVPGASGPEELNHSIFAEAHSGRVEDGLGQGEATVPLPGVSGQTEGRGDAGPTPLPTSTMSTSSSTPSSPASMPASTAPSGSTPSRSTVTSGRGVEPSGRAEPEQRVAAAGQTPTVRSGDGSGDTGAAAPIDVPGPPAPEAPNGYRDEVQATFGTSRERLEGLHEPTALADQRCRILIFHTHTSETYRSDSFSPEQADQYHLWNSTDAGIVQVGRIMKRSLEDRFGIPTCHVTTIHDWPSHARAYVESRVTVEEFLRKNPQVELVLDVHRDSPSGLVTTVAGRTAAQVAAVVGTHPTMHPASGTNVAVAEQIGRLIEQRYPGMFRRVIERPDARLNQDLHPRAIILEIGSYDTHVDAALETGALLAEVLAETVTSMRTDRGSGAGAVR